MRAAATSYEDELTLEEARGRYFEANGFGADGGYAAAWVEFELGPISFPFPNTPARRRAVRFHDLHHIVTGYQTDLTGEMEISAWEIGSGCRGMIAAWQLNLSALAGGAVFAPRRAFRAFVRGRRSENFYGRAELPLSMRVGEARRALGLDGPAARASAADAVLFATAVAAGGLTGLVTFALVTPLALLAWPWLALARRRSRASG